MDATITHALKRKENISKVENTLRKLSKDMNREYDEKDFIIYLSDELCITFRTAKEYIKVAKRRIKHGKT